MALKILLADDNLTAQRLGAKILTDAGHEVITVSNGAAAVKKIASEKPQLLILDVYMPGYSGLEVCAKVKAAPETAKLPVLLTVTSMEPFNPEEGNKAKADGVMIKPFVASDLLAVVEKFARQRQPAAAPPPAYQPARMPASKGFDDASYEEWKAEAADEEETPARLAVPHEMAAAPALGVEEMSAPPVSAEPGPSAATPAPAVEAPTFAVPPPMPAFGEEHAAPPFEILVMPAAEPEPAPAFELAVGPVAEISQGEVEPAVDIAPPEELEFTAAPPAGEVEIQLASELEPEIHPADIQPVIVQDPALVTSPEEMAEFKTTFGVEHADEEEFVVGVVTPELQAELAPETEPAPEPVAEAAPEPPAEPEPEPRIEVALEPASRFADEIGAKEITPEPPTAEPEPLAEEKAPPVEASAGGGDDVLEIPAEPVAEPGLDTVPIELLPEEPQPASAEHVEVSAEPETSQAFAVSGGGAAAAPAREPAAPATRDELVAQFAAELERAAHAEPEPRAEPEGEPPAEAAMPAAAASEEQRLIEALSSAFDRFKGDLIAAIVREMKK